MPDQPQPAASRGTPDVADYDVLWWQRPGLQSVGGRLHIAGRDAEELARTHGTPLFVYDLEHVRETLVRLRTALRQTGMRTRVRVALKANRDPEYLAVIRGLGAPGSDGAIGMDVCTPGEVEHALANGFLPEEISVTGTNLSERDYAAILAHPVHVNADLVTQIDRVGRLSPGRAIGLRINPRAGVVNARTTEGITLYSSEKPTKFGIYLEDLTEAVATARRHGLTVDTVHFHITNGLLDDDLPAFEPALAATVPLIERLIDLGCPIAEINVGGGLGAPFHAEDRSVDLDTWAGILERHLSRFGAVIACEPGEFVAFQSGVLLAEVVTVEWRLGHLFAGLDVGWNVANHHFVYGLDLELAPCVDCEAPRTDRVTFTGNINEGPDIFAQDLPFPPVREGDIVALLNLGAYSRTMYHPHCLRPAAGVVHFADRLAPA
jgi:diaminopimelate decarboxylase